MSLWRAAPMAAALAACEIPEPSDAAWVIVPPGASVEAVAESLAVHDIVKSSRAFRRFARMGRKHLGIQPGVYALRPGTPMGEILATLRKGRPPVGRIVVRPGIMLSELGPVLERALGIGADDVELAARDSSLRTRIGATGESLEGYLYPTAYYVRLGASASEVVRQMVDTFEARWQPEWHGRLDSLGRTRDEIVTLASIIEGEMPHESDRPLVASVYHNRLARGMRLQADPTVVYALGERRRLSHQDYAVPSAYNTYLIDGLPPAPIGQSSVASLEAALYPPSSDFYYFVARPDGRHVFSRSYREHLATIRQVRTAATTQGAR